MHYFVSETLPGIVVIFMLFIVYKFSRSSNSSNDTHEVNSVSNANLSPEDARAEKIAKLRHHLYEASVERASAIQEGRMTEAALHEGEIRQIESKLRELGA